MHECIFLTSFLIEIPPSALNVNITCSSIVNTTTRSYDVIVLFYIDATFTRSTVAAIESIRTTIIEVNSDGNVIPSNIMRVTFPFGGIESGPGSVVFVISNKRPLSDSQSFYSIQVRITKIQYKISDHE